MVCDSRHILLTLVDLSNKNWKVLCVAWEASSSVWQSATK